jgi:hypothetical protein
MGDNDITMDGNLGAVRVIPVWAVVVRRVARSDAYIVRYTVSNDKAWLQDNLLVFSPIVIINMGEVQRCLDNTISKTIVYKERPCLMLAWKGRLLSCEREG